MNCGSFAKKLFTLLKAMPVDKFGRTDTTNTTRVISGGITLSQANNAFLRRDGGNMQLQIST